MTDPKYDRDRLCGDDVTPQEQELLVRLMEEAGEVVQACAKTLRWGWASVNPTLPAEEQEANGDYLRRELYDLVSLAERLDLLVSRAPVSLVRAFTEGADWGQFRAIGESADTEDRLEAEEQAQRRYPSRFGAASPPQDAPRRAEVEVDERTRQLGRLLAKLESKARYRGGKAGIRAAIHALVVPAPPPRPSRETVEAVIARLNDELCEDDCEHAACSAMRDVRATLLALLGPAGGPANDSQPEAK